MSTTPADGYDTVADPEPRCLTEMILITGRSSWLLTNLLTSIVAMCLISTPCTEIADTLARGTPTTLSEIDESTVEANPTTPMVIRPVVPPTKRCR